MPSSPTDTAEAPVPDQKEVDSALANAESSGKLKPLDDVMKEYGWDIPSADLIVLAQKDERTQGKTPDELASMLRDDPSLYDDLAAYQPGGALAKPDEGESMAEEEKTDPGMKDEEMAPLGNFEGEDMKKAKGALKQMGRSPKDTAKSFSAKADFLGRMAE